MTPSTDAHAATDPFERFGWVLGVVWLVFLAFPLAAAVQAPTAVVWRVAGCVLIVAFATVYVWGYARLAVGPALGSRPGPATGFLVVLGLLALATAPVIGLGALGFFPFLLSFGMFTLPLRPASVLAAGLTAASVLLPLSVGELDQWWFFGLIVAAVLVVTVAIRVMVTASEEYTRIRHELTLTAERERVARDVHDVLGHSLTVVTIKAELAEKLMDSAPERARAELSQIQHLTRQALAEIRATVGGLRMVRLADEVDSANTALADAGVEVTLVGDEATVDPGHRTLFAWVLREAVTNVVRHSGARHCRITLAPACLVVTDDGTGMRPGAEGNGIRGLRERLAQTGGTLHLSPGPGGTGTSLEARP